MGSSEETKSSKPEKTSSLAKDQPDLHVYPDWAAMQVYYGPRVPVPPYFNSPVPNGHPPHPYMWGPLQPMMPPYGAPYAAMYAHGGVHPHPGAPMGSPHANGPHANSHSVVPSSLTSEAMVAIPLSMETPSKPLANGEQGLMSKLKGFNGLAMSTDNGNAQSGDDSHGRSQSEEFEGSSDGSCEIQVAVCTKGKKRNREKSPHKAEERKHAALRTSLPSEELVGSCRKVMTSPVVLSNAIEKVGPTLSPKMTTALELGNSCGVMNVKTVPANSPQACAVIPGEAWMQNEKDLKREKRKQSNRESARRSRLRKQAEAEELGKKVQALSAENMTLVSEINGIKGNSELLRLENAKLMEKLQNAKLGPMTDLSLHKVDETVMHPIGTADLLARVNNSGSVDNRANDECEMFDNNNSNNNKHSGAKLRQLLDAGPRADAVAAG